MTEDRQGAPPPGSHISDLNHVVATVIYPFDEAPVPLSKAVGTMLAQHFSTATAAKKAIRRKEILVDGKLESNISRYALHATSTRLSCVHGRQH